MTSKGRSSAALSEAGALLANLSVFLALATWAFARNLVGLFYSFDGLYMLIEVLNRTSAVQPLFSFSSDFLQSVGNIQFLQNPRLLFFLWPVNWFNDLEAGRIAAFLAIATIVFLSTYTLARLLRQGPATALLAGWLLGVLVTPFVPDPFFYHILWVAPAGVLFVVCPVILYWLLSLAGRSGVVGGLISGGGLLMLVAYMLAANPSVVLLLVFGMAPYVGLALLGADGRPALLRKCAVLVGVLAASVALGWPWFLLGLFSYTSTNLFPADFSSVYQDAIYVSVMFHYAFMGWSGAIFIGLATVGALLSLFRGSRTRPAAAVMLAAIAVLLVSRGVLFFTKNWILPPPIYVEIALWPLYALFASIAVRATAGWLLGKLLPGPAIADRGLLLPMPAAAITLLLVTSQQPRQFAPFPPTATPIVDMLRANISLEPGAKFNGRVATILPVELEGADAWVQQFTAAYNAWGAVGNDLMTIGLWYFRIPTLFEYNQYASPVFHALTKRALQDPVVPHQRNITVFSKANERILKLLGVRYLVMVQDSGTAGSRRMIENVGGRLWHLFELEAPNLATYSPTMVEVRTGLAATLDFVVDDRVDLSQSAVVAERVEGKLVPAEGTVLSMAGGDLRVVSRSSGRSLIVVPFEFSRCVELLGPSAGGGRVRLVRTNGSLTGIVFEGALDVVLAYRTGPLRNPTCRWQDYRDVTAMLP